MCQWGTRPPKIGKCTNAHYIGYPLKGTNTPNSLLIPEKIMTKKFENSCVGMLCLKKKLRHNVEFFFRKR